MYDRLAQPRAAFAHSQPQISPPYRVLKLNANPPDTIG